MEWSEWSAFASLIWWSTIISYSRLEKRQAHYRQQGEGPWWTANFSKISLLDMLLTVWFISMWAWNLSPKNLWELLTENLAFTRTLVNNYCLNATCFLYSPDIYSICVNAVVLKVGRIARLLAILRRKGAKKTKEAIGVKITQTARKRWKPLPLIGH